METMTPSQITQGQIGKINDNLGAALRKSGLPSEPVQALLENPRQANALNAELVAVVRKHIEAASNLIIRRVRVDRSRTPQQVLDATGRVQYTDKGVVNSMPRGEGEETEVVFFKLNRYINDDDLAKEYELRGLVPDPYAQAAVNEADPAFADTHPNGTHWKDAEGKWNFATFHRWFGGRSVDVGRDGSGWSDFWWFQGVRK